MRFRLSLAATLLAMLLAVGCSPTQAAQYLNDTGRGPVSASSQTAQDASRLFTAFWAAMMTRIPYEANWDRVAQCESGGRWDLRGSPYSGGLQFSVSTWHSVGGVGEPWQNSKREQIYRAEILRGRAGLGQWPVCGRLWYG